MRIETFVKRATGQVNAERFIAEHRNFLCGFKSVLPILAMLERGEIFPTPALVNILTVLVTEKDPDVKDIEVVDKETGEITVKSLSQVEKEPAKKEPKTYTLFLFCKDDFGGEECVETFEADLWQDVERLSHRTLFRKTDSIYMDVYGMGVTTRISREDAVREILRCGPMRGGNTATKRTSKMTSSLSWGMKAKTSTSKFSRG